MDTQIQDFILDTKLVLVENTQKQTKQTTKQEISYILVLENENDFAIKRITKKTESMLVIIPEKQQYYIKDSRQNLVALTESNLSAFLSDIGTLSLTKVQWMSQVVSGINFVRALLWAIKNETIMKMCMEGLMVIGPLVGHERGFNCERGHCEALEELYLSCPALYKSVVSTIKQFNPGLNNFEIYKYCSQDTNRFHDRASNVCKGLIMCYKDLLYLNLHFGLNNTRKFIKEFFTSLIPTYGGECLIQFFALNHDYHLSYEPYDTAPAPVLSFDFDAFMEYAIQQCVYQCFGFFPSFINEWRDELSQQLEIYGKIREKYPPYLSSLHQRTSYKYTLKMKEQEIILFEKTAEKMSALNYSPAGNEFFIIAPTTSCDMIDEAEQQSNCLASYIKAVIRGQTHIVFLRKTAEPDKSYVTIQVTPDKIIIQAKGKGNHEPKEEDKEFIREWAKAKGLEYTESRFI